MRIKLSENAEIMWTSIVASAIVGWFIGVGQLLIMGSWDLFYWSLMPMVPLYSALGWGAYGMILGGSGVFSRPSRQETREVERARTAHAA